jgi:hypothetical protein
LNIYRAYLHAKSYKVGNGTRVGPVADTEAKGAAKFKPTSAETRQAVVRFARRKRERPAPSGTNFKTEGCAPQYEVRNTLMVTVELALKEATTNERGRQLRAFSFLRPNLDLDCELSG